MQIAYLRGQDQLLTKLLQINSHLLKLGGMPLNIAEPDVTARNTVNTRANNQLNLRLNRTEKRARAVQTDSRTHIEQHEEGSRVSVQSQLRDPIVVCRRVENNRNNARGTRVKKRHRNEEAESTAREMVKITLTKMPMIECYPKGELPLSALEC